MSEAAASRSSTSASRFSKALLAPVLLLYGAWYLFELCRPDLLIVGNITVDLVDGTTPTGGAVSYAAVAAQALGATSCIVTVAGPEADVDVFGDAELYIIPANETLTFEHTYTWWGHSRRLRVTANPNITLGRAHVPWRCRWARVVLLGPLTLHDVDARSFAHHEGFLEQLLNRNQLIGLMAQGFQRDLSHDGEVLPLPAPSKQLLAGLSKHVHLFLSDVETDTWSQQDLNQVVSSAGQVVITQGEKGATLLAAQDNGSSSGSGSGSSSRVGSIDSSSGFQQWKIPAVKVPKAIDTNGAGDTFATMYMLAAMRGDPSPGSTASWAASRAVLQPQTCKPRCAPQLITAPGGLPVLGQMEKGWIAAVPLAQHLAGVAAGLVRRVAGLVPTVPELAQAAEWLEGCSRSSGWGRDFGSRLGSAASIAESAGVKLQQRVEPSPSAGSDRVVAAATAVPQTARAGVQQQ